MYPARRADRTLGRSGRLAPAAEHDRSRLRGTGSACRKWTPSSGRGSSGAPASSASARSTRRSCPTEWDEADLAFRIRQAGWKVATCGYERLGGYEHLGSSTLGALVAAYKERVLRNGRLFHERWDAEIARDHARPRRTWTRPQSVSGWINTARQIGTVLTNRVRSRKGIRPVVGSRTASATAASGQRADRGERPAPSGPRRAASVSTQP